MIKPKLECDELQCKAFDIKKFAKQLEKKD